MNVRQRRAAWLAGQMAKLSPHARQRAIEAADNVIDLRAHFRISQHDSLRAAARTLTT